MLYCTSKVGNTINSVTYLFWDYHFSFDSTLYNRELYFQNYTHICHVWVKIRNFKNFNKKYVIFIRILRYKIISYTSCLYLDTNGWRFWWNKLPRYHPLMNLQTKAIRISSGPQPKRLKEIMQNNWLLLSIWSLEKLGWIKCSIFLSEIYISYEILKKLILI